MWSSQFSLKKRNWEEQCTQRNNVDLSTTTNQVCNAAKQLAGQTSPVLSYLLPSLFFALILSPSASMGLSHALFLRSQGACYSSSNSTWQGDLCPTQDGLNWGWKGWGVPCPVSNPMVSALLLPCPGPNTGLRWERERQWRQPAPLCWASCWTLERGKRRGRERPTKTHTPKVLFMSMPILTENAHSQSHKSHVSCQPTRHNRIDDRHVGEVSANALSPQIQVM